MPAVIMIPGDAVHALQPRQTPDFSNRPPFQIPPFIPPDDLDLDLDDELPDTGPFIDHDADDIDIDDDRGGTVLSSGTIAAIVVSVVVFFVLVMAVFAYIHHRKRKAAAKDDFAMKESADAEAVTASGVLDPPPPYELAGHHGETGAGTGTEAGTGTGTGTGTGARQRYDNLSNASDVSDEMGSHATITDGIEPGSGNSSRQAGMEMPAELHRDREGNTEPETKKSNVRYSSEAER